MNKKELIEKRLIDSLDDWVWRYRANLTDRDAWDKQAYDKIKEIIRGYARGGQDE
jgi:hypothetical protein